MRRTLSKRPLSAPVGAGAPAASVVDGQAAEPLAAGGLFVTPDGTWLREGSGEFLAALGDPEPDYDAPAFAIKNLGFIFVRIVAASLVDITLHPRNVAPAALCSLQRWLQSHRPGLFRLNYMRDRCISEILTTPAQAMSRLFEVCAVEMTDEPNSLEPPVTGNTAARQVRISSLAH